MGESPLHSQGKMTFHLYLHPTKTVQMFSDTYRFATPTSLPRKGFSSLLQQNEDQTREKEDMLSRRSNLNLDCNGVLRTANDPELQVPHGIEGKNQRVLRQGCQRVIMQKKGSHIV